MAAGLSSCAYYRGEGTCSFGCWDEPRCQTDEPMGGWAMESGHVIVRAFARLRLWLQTRAER